jgi:hypothetical protein
MPTKIAERLKQTVSLVEDRVKDGKSEDAFKDLTFLAQQYSRFSQMLCFSMS